jgi:hypothetical protein
MSKHRRLFCLLLSIATIAVPVRIDRAQAVRLEVGDDARVRVESEIGPGRNLSFLRSIAGVDGVSDRVSNVRFRNSASNGEISFKRLVSGEYLADADFNSVVYDLDLTPLKNRPAAAHVSWISGDTGVLMLGDLLPQPISAARLTIALPTAWPVLSAEKKLGSEPWAVDAPEDAIFYVGSGWRPSKAVRGSTSPELIVSGNWHFTDDEAAEMVADIYGEYRKIFGYDPGSSVQIAIAKFPVQTPPGEWQAETRGRSVTIISSDMPFKTQSLQRLHEQLRHELFHLWIPNSLSLKGNYDWFYEGFAMYESLKLGVRLNRIRFEDFLDTLSRAHTIDSAIPRKQSLIQASANRFTGSNTQVYARGMLVAFLSDLILLQRSKGKLAVEDMLLELTRHHRKPQPAMDGNAAVTKLLRDQVGAGTIVERYIEGVEMIDLSRELKDTGIENIGVAPVTNLRVKQKLKGGEKSLLDRLGYNNWRKLTGSSK